MKLIGFELRRITGRRGSFYGVMAFATVIALIGLVTHGVKDENNWSNILGIPLVFGSTIIGALAGSYDAAQGTMRYLVLTGEPRWRLVAIRVPALLITIILFSLIACVMCAISMSSDHQPTVGIARAIGGSLLFAAVWGTVSMTVGTLLRSNGAGIAVALVLFLVGSLLTGFVHDHVWSTAGNYLLPSVTSIVAQFGHVTSSGGPDFKAPYAAALVALVIWIAAFVGVAILRVERDEY
jgi:ABC-type transport system involved in multi-copper enzyme maturation permease subunit